MSESTIVGAVNGVAVTRDVQTSGADLFTLDVADDGSPTTIDVNTDGEDPIAPAGAGPDRVAVIGGSTVERDHFPFAVVDYDGGVSAQQYAYLLDLGLGGAAIAFYRVKRWKWTASFAISATTTTIEDEEPVTHDGGATFHAEAVTDARTNDEFETELTRESELVVNYWRQTNIVSFGADTATPTGEATLAAWSDFNVRLFGNESGMFPPLRWKEGLGGIWGLMYCHFAVSFEMPGGLIEVAVDSEFSDILETVSWDMPTFTNGYLNAQTIGGDSVIVSGTVTIEPYEYWPYATKAGLPVYDTGDGSQINDPLS